MAWRGRLRLLLDTHAVLWWLKGDPALPPMARAAILAEDNTIFVSAVSAMEVTTKHRIGKLPQAATLALRFEDMVADQGFVPLSLTLPHGALAGRLSIEHKDPFDRMLIAQALVEGMTLISNETLFDRAGVARLW